MKDQDKASPTPQQIERVAEAIFNADQVGSWDAEDDARKDRYRAMSAAALAEWEQLRQPPTNFYKLYSQWYDENRERGVRVGRWSAAVIAVKFAEWCSRRAATPPVAAPPDEPLNGPIDISPTVHSCSNPSVCHYCLRRARAVSSAEPSAEPSLVELAHQVERESVGEEGIPSLAAWRLARRLEAEPPATARDAAEKIAAFVGGEWEEWDLDYVAKVVAASSTQGAAPPAAPEREAENKRCSEKTCVLSAGHAGKHQDSYFNRFRAEREGRE